MVEIVMGDVVSKYHEELKEIYCKWFKDFDEECFDVTLKDYLGYYTFTQEPSLNTIKRTYVSSIRLTIENVKTLGCKKGLLTDLVLYKFLYSWFAKESEKTYGNCHGLNDYVSFKQLLPIYTELAGDIDKLNPDKNEVSEKELVNFNFIIFLNKIHYFYYCKGEKLNEKNKQEFVEDLKQKSS
jgi:hypothetical protein